MCLFAYCINYNVSCMFLHSLHYCVGENLQYAHIGFSVRLSDCITKYQGICNG